MDPRDHERTAAQRSRGEGSIANLPFRKEEKRKSKERGPIIRLEVRGDLRKVLPPKAVEEKAGEDRSLTRLIPGGSLGNRRGSPNVLSRRSTTEEGIAGKRGVWLPNKLDFDLLQQRHF